MMMMMLMWRCSEQQQQLSNQTHHPISEARQPWYTTSPFAELTLAMASVVQSSDNDKNEAQPAENGVDQDLP